MRSVLMPRGVPNEVSQFARSVIDALSDLDSKVASSQRAQVSAGDGGAQAPGAYFAISADLTLSLNSLCRWLIFSVSGARNLTLPAAIRGGWLGVCNDNTGTLAIKDGGTTLVTLSQNEYCFIRCLGDGANGFQWPDKVYKEKLDGTFTPGLPIAITSGGTGLSALGTANQIFGMDALAAAGEWKTVAGTSNQVTVTHSLNTITLSTPQNIHTGASPTFAGMTLSGLTNTHVLYSASGVVSGSAAMTFTVGTGQLALSTTGSAAGILIGGDAIWYRSAADVMHTLDQLTVAAPVVGGTATSGYGALVSRTFTPSGASSGRVWGLNFTIYGTGAQNMTDATGGLTGVEGAVQYQGTGTVTALCGMILSPTVTAAGTITTCVTGDFYGVDLSTTGTCTTGMTLRVRGPRGSGGGTATTYTTIRIDPRAWSSATLTSYVALDIHATQAIYAYSANNQTRIGLDIGAMPSPGAFTGTTTAAIRIVGTAGAIDGILFSNVRIFRGASAILHCDGGLKSIHATNGIGYGTGAGGTVTQATSKATGVTLNTACGQITMNNAALAAATSVSFTLTNSAIAATDTIVVNIQSAATLDAYTITVTAVAAGSCRIQLRNESAGSLSEALVLNFAVIKGVTS